MKILQWLRGLCSSKRTPPDEDESRNINRLFKKHGIRSDPEQIIRDAEIRSLPIVPGSPVLMAHMAVCDSEAAARYALEEEDGRVARLSVRGDTTTAHHIARHHPSLFSLFLDRPEMLVISDRTGMRVLESALVNNPHLGLLVLARPEVALYRMDDGRILAELVATYSPEAAELIVSDPFWSNVGCSTGRPLQSMARAQLEVRKSLDELRLNWSSRTGKSSS